MTPVSENLRKEELPGVAKGAAVNLVFQFLDKVIGFVFAVLVIRFIGMGRFGLYNVGVSIVYLSSMLSMAGMSEGVVREGSVLVSQDRWGAFRGLIRFVVKLTLGLSVVLALLLILLRHPVAQLFWRPLEGEVSSSGYAWALIPLGVSIPFFALAVIMVQTSMALRVMRHAGVVKNFAEPLIKVFGFVALYYLGFRLGAVVGSFLLTSVACFWLALVLLRGLLWKVPTAASEPPNPRKLLAYSLPLLGPNLLNNVLVWVDTLLLGYFTTSQSVGLFSVILKILLIPDMILRSYSAAAMPRLASMISQGAVADWQEFYHQVGRWIFATALPFYLFFIIRSELSLMILGREFTTGASFLAILCVGPLLLSAIGPADSLMAMAGRSRYQLFNAMAVLVINVLANIFLLPRFGPIAMAWTMTGSIFLYGLLLLVETSCLFRFVTPTFRLVQVAASILPAVGCLLWLRPVWANAYLEFVFEGSLFFGVYGFTLLTVGMGRKDREVLIAMCRRIWEHLQQIRRRDGEKKFL